MSGAYVPGLIPELLPVAMVGGLLAGLGLAIYGVISAPPQPPSPEPAFQNGDIVSFVVSPDVQGMVVYTDCYRKCTYSVRVPFLSSRTRTHLLGPDGTIAANPMGVVNYVEEFEIRSVK